MSNVSERLKKNRSRYLSEVEAIRSDGDLTPEARARRMRPVFEEAKRREKELRRQRRDELRERARSAERAVFSPPALYGSDPALSEMNYRHALDSVAETTGGRELSEKLERALLTGDKAMARAVAWRANQTGSEAVVNAYLESDEDAKKKYEKWAQAYGELERVEAVGEELAYGEPSVDRPPELGAGGASGAGLDPETHQGAEQDLRRALERAMVGPG